MGAADFRRNFEAGDIDAVAADFAPDFTMYHPSHPEPSTNPAWMARTLQLIREVFGPEFHFDRHMVDGRDSAIHWTTTLEDGTPAEGVDLVREDEAGRLLELRVLVRPLDAMVSMREAMQRRTGGWDAQTAHQRGDDAESRTDHI